MTERAPRPQKGPERGAGGMPRRVRAPASESSSKSLPKPPLQSPSPPSPTEKAPRKRAPSVAPAEKRVRRTAEDARNAIVDAARKRMAAVGPGGLRLQDVAADVGVSHPTILHHFGSREGLVDAVVHRAVDALHTSLLEEIAKGRRGEEPIADMLEATARVLGPMGHARVVGWLSLGGQVQDTRGSESLSRIARASHELRRTHRGPDTPAYEDTQFIILLAAFALFGDAIVGPMLVGDETEKARERRGRRFRAWLATVLQHHLEHGGTPTA